MLKRAVLLFLLLLTLYILNAFLNPFPKKNVPEGFKPKYGFSYNFEQATWYGLDSRKSYTQLLDQVKFDWVRLPFFWDEMVDESGEFRLEDDKPLAGRIENLKFAIEAAKKRNVKVIVTLGLKTPYYPEYHLPKYISKQIKFGQTIDTNHPIVKDLLQVDKKLVEELSVYDNILAWQVENEPYLANVNNWKIGQSLISREVQLVRETDPKSRPIILSHALPISFDRRYRVLLELLRPGDILGVNAYFTIEGINLLSFKILGREINIGWPKWLDWPVQSWHGLSPDFRRLEVEVNKKGVKLWALEMQAEPYIRSLKDARKERFNFNASDIAKGDTFLKAQNVQSVGLWGASFWQFRESIGDKSWMEAVKAIVN